MAAFKQYTASGGASENFSIPSFTSDEINVRVDGVLKTAATHYNITNYTANGGTVTWTAGNAPASGTVRIYRITDLDPAQATYTAGSAVKALDLNNNQTQVLRSLSETVQQPDILLQTWDVENDAITTDKIKDNTIVDGNISTTAEIAVSKLKDGTARQVLQTASNGSDVEWTSNVDVPGTLDVTGAADFDSTVNVDGTATLATVDINAGAIDGTTIGANSTAAGSFTTVNASGTITGNLTGNVTGNITGNVTGNSDTATDLAAAAKITNSEQAAHTANDTTYYTTSASDSRYYNIGSTEEIVSSETWVSDDTSIATTKAVDNRVINLVDEVGGFVPITDESDFPATNPDINSAAGTIVSVGTLTASYTPSGGTVTIAASTLDNLSNDLTITGCGSTVLAAGFGVLVETKALSDTAYAANPSYTFHRLTPKSSEVTTVAGISGNITTVAGISSNVTTVAGIAANVTTVAGNNSNVTTVAGKISDVETVSDNITAVENFADLYQIHNFSSAPTTDGGGNAVAEGDLAFDSTANQLKVYTGSAWEAGVSNNTNTTYTHTWQDSSNDALLRLTAGGSGTGNDDLKIVAGTNITLTPNGDDLTITASGGEITVQDEGNSLSTAATTLNFVGSNVTATGSGATKTITVSGGAGNATDFKYLELKAHNNTSGAFSAGAADYELVTAGTTTAVSPDAANALLISVAGVIQKPNTGTSIGSNDGFCIDGSSIHFGGNLGAHPDFIIYLSGGIIATVSDNAITLAKLEDGTSGNDGKFLRANNGADPTWETVNTTIASSSITEAQLDIHASPSGTDKFLKYTSNGMEWVVPSYTTNTDTNTQLTQEQVEDFVGGMLDGTETGISVSYDDTDGNIDFVVASQTDNNFTNTLKTKLDGIAASANNYVHPNHSGEVTSTADGATVIADDIVDEANLKVSNSPTNGYVLTAQSGNTGGLTWAEASAGTITALNNQAANRLTTIGGTTTELDGEASLTFEDTVSTGLISGKQITGRGFECPATVSDDWTIAAGNNAMFPGPMTVAANKTVTIPANRTLTIV